MANESLQNARFQELCSHFGGGNPSGGIWIIGIEEAGEWQDESEIDAFIDARRGMPYDWREPGDPQVLAWKGLGPIVSKIGNGITGLCSSWREFRENHFLTRTGPLFMSNLYPLAKPDSSAMPDQYSYWFGIKDAEDYREKVIRSGRFQKLIEMWQQYRPEVTICHGSECWPDYRSALSLEPVAHKTEDGKIEMYEQGVFLTPHLSWAAHMPDSQIEQLVGRAKVRWRAES